MNDKGDIDIIKTIIAIPITIVTLYVAVMVFPVLFSVITGDMAGAIDTDGRFYDSGLIDTVGFAFDSWYSLVILSAASGFVYLGLLVWKRQRYSEEDSYEDYFR
jgi:hypothetical protein